MNLVHLAVDPGQRLREPGEPEGAGSQPRPSKRSAAGRENRRDSSSWSSARTLTQKVPARRIDGQVFDSRPTQKPTSAGSSDTEKKAPTATPTGAPSSIALITVTPLGKWPRAWRNRAWSTPAPTRATVARSSEARVSSPPVRHGRSAPPSAAPKALADGASAYGERSVHARTHPGDRSKVVSRS